LPLTKSVELIVVVRLEKIAQSGYFTGSTVNSSGSAITAV
jgi:hypothetical protein